MIVEAMEQGVVDVNAIADLTGLAPGTVTAYSTYAWRELRPGVKAPRLRGTPRAHQRSVEVDEDEEADRRLRERMLRKPTAGELHEALGRLGGGNGVPRELPVTRERLREAPTFGGLMLSRDELEARMARALARVAGHIHFDDLPEETRGRFRLLADRAVLALELVEAEMRRAARPSSAPR